MRMKISLGVGADQDERDCIASMFDQASRKITMSQKRMLRLLKGKNY